jgi:hypothetical protein
MKKKAPRSQRGKGTAQKVAAMKSLTAGAKVALTVGKA